jgi:hypothetical protein
VTQPAYIADDPARVPPAFEVAHPRPERARLLAPLGIATLVAVALGWSTREEHYLVPYEGLGYALGIAGLAMMIALLLYSLRKRWSLLRRAGRVQRWFHVHMALGILGPAAILFHANFQLGSLNANVALACMLTVSLSGIVGRFIYTRVHFEYLGRVATLSELRGDARSEGRALVDVVRHAPEVGRVLGEFREACLVTRRTWVGRAGAFLALGHRGRKTRRRALRAWRAGGAPRDRGPGPSSREVRRAVREQIRAIRRVAEYAAYERAFALWHAFHLPFCVVLFIAAAVHVVAVHMY